MNPNKMKYSVNIHNSSSSTFAVEATSVEEAQAMAEEGKGDITSAHNNFSINVSEPQSCTVLPEPNIPG